MNTFKTLRENFIKKYFYYPEDMEKSIRLAGVEYFTTSLLEGNILHKLERYDKPERLIKLLETHGFSQHYHWSYSYKENYNISDWCAIYWQKGTGLVLHFEWCNIGDKDDDFNDVDMDDDAWNFLYSKRKTILSNFCGGKYIDYYKEEDFFVVLIDLSDF